MPENARVLSQAKQIQQIAENLVIAAQQQGLRLTINDGHVTVQPIITNQGEKSE
jgi:hypothetical protein